MKVPWKSTTAQPGDADWQRVAIYGFGASGQAATAFLRSRGVETVIFDRRSREEIGGISRLDENGEGIEWHLGTEPVGDVTPLLRGLDGVVVSPGVPLDRPLLAAARQGGLPVIGEVELAFPFLRGEVIGITGSNGKSTTTAMAGAMLRQAGWPVEICGNIGVPLCSVVDANDDSDTRRCFVVELSSFQLETVDTLRPRAAALLNLSADHLDRHGGMESYRAAKARLFARQTQDDIAVLNADDPWVGDLALAARRRFFSLRGPQTDGCFLQDAQVWESTPGQAARVLFDLETVPLPGPHNLENAMAAALLARTLGAESSDLMAALRNFRGLPHRMEKVAEIDGVIWYDDSKGTNPGATERSLEGFSDRQVHLILGGRNKGAAFDSLFKTVARKAVWVYLIGESAALFEDLLQGAEVRITRSETLDRAVDQAVENAQAGEVVLLSPACASFDQFRNFIERGQVFQQLVHALQTEAEKTRG